MGLHSTASYGGSRFTSQGISCEDITIAQGLLVGNPPGVPSRGSSYFQLPSDMNRQSENQPPNYTYRRSRYNTTSNTWTSSSGEVSETDDIGDRTFYVQAFNKIANQHGIPELIPDGQETVNMDKVVITGKQGSWLMRRILKRTSSMLAMNKPKIEVRHKRSISDISLRMTGAKKDAFKDRHLAEIVRLCGSSPFYLPAEYAPGTLNLPTCFRATAQYLVQRGPSMKGIFRISGSHATVAALYDHYASQDEDGDVISDTVRCPTLPENIECDEHDVASTFKKFLSGLPGGILGKMWLFDALVAIHDQMGVGPELTKTRQSKVRARLIACAISTLSSRFQRDLICAVFGLLCMIGRASEIAQREDVDGRPLPTNELMGYGSLGTVFGPLLLGKLIEEYKPRHGELQTDPLQGRASPKKRSRHKKTKSIEESLIESKVASDKLRVANRVAEMLITHWRDVIRHMKSLNNIGSSLVQYHLQERGKGKHPLLRPSASESFFLRRPPDWEPVEQSNRLSGRSDSPTPPPRNPLRVRNNASEHSLPSQPQEAQQIRRQRSRPKSQPSHKLSGTRSMSVLTPPREDSSEVHYEHLDCGCRTPKVTGRTLSGRPATENETISSGDSLYRDLLSTVQTASEDSASTELRLAATSSLFGEPLFEDGYLIIRRAATVSRSEETQAPVETEPLKGPAEKSTLNDSIANTTVEASQEQNFRENKETDKETPTKLEINDGIMNRKGKRIMIEYDSNEFLTTTQRNKADNDVPPGVRQIPGQSPSNHLERILFANIPEAIVQRTPAYGSTRSAYRSAGSSQFAAGPHASLKASEERPWHHRMEPNSLARVSHEQDVASLAALAQALMSDNNEEFHSLNPSDNTTDFSSDQGVVGNATSEKLKSKRGESDSARSRGTNDSTTPESFAVDSLTLRTPSPRTVATLKEFATTPRRPTPDPLKTLKGHEGGIKSLIGKFNSVDQGAGITSPSPARSPVPWRNKYSLQSPSSVLATYTLNHSPVVNSRDSVLPGWSHAIESSQKDIDMEALSPKSVPVQLGLRVSRPKSASLVSNDHQVETQLRFPTLTPSKRHPGGKGSHHGMGHITNTVQPNLNMVRHGGGNENLDASAQSNTDKRRLKPLKLPNSDERCTTPQPRSTSVSSDPRSSIDPRSSNGSNAANPKLSASVAEPVPCSTIVGTGSQGKGTSVLFSQITNLQRQLETRTEEAENLRKQLHTKGSLNDLSTLAEQLREAKRETAVWQKRAEMAERHLERLSQLAPLAIGYIAGEEPTPLDIDAVRRGIRELPIIDERNFRTLDIVRSAQQGDMDGARSTEGSTDTQGTIMRTTPKSRKIQGQGSADGLEAFTRTVRKFRETSGEDLISFPETDEMVQNLKLTTANAAKAYELP